MDVVDQHEQGRAGREVRGQPVEPVQRGRPGVDGRGAVLEHRCGQRGRAGQQVWFQHGLEQLADDGEREVALQLGAARGEHAVLGRRGASAAEQAGLPDPGRPFDQQRATVLQHAADRLELAVAFLERAVGEGGHGTPRYGR